MEWNPNIRDLILKIATHPHFWVGNLPFYDWALRPQTGVVILVPLMLPQTISAYVRDQCPTKPTTSLEPPTNSAMLWMSLNVISKCLDQISDKGNTLATGNEWLNAMQSKSYYGCTELQQWDQYRIIQRTLMPSRAQNTLSRQILDSLKSWSNVSRPRSPPESKNPLNSPLRMWASRLTRGISLNFISL